MGDVGSSHSKSTYLNEHLKRVKRTKVNPLTLIVINIIAPTIMPFLPMSIIMNGAFLIAFGLLVYEGKTSRALKFLGVFAVLRSIEFAIIQGFITNQLVIALATTFVIMNQYMLMFMFASLLMFDTPSSDLLNALEKLHLPKKMIIALTLMFRYFPIFGRERKIIKESMQMRGITTSWKTPARNLEYIMVPQLFRCSILAEELTAAGLTRGLDAPCKRGAWMRRKLSACDYVLIALCMGVVLGGVYVKYF